jgi:hypothetical protein
MRGRNAIGAGFFHSGGVKNNASGYGLFQRRAA